MSKEKKSLSDALGEGLNELLGAIAARANESLPGVIDRLAARLNTEFGLKDKEQTVEKHDVLRVKESDNLKQLRLVTKRVRNSWWLSASTIAEQISTIVQWSINCSIDAAHRGVFATEVQIRLPPELAEVMVKEINQKLTPMYRRVLISEESIATIKDCTHVIYLDWADV